LGRSWLCLIELLNFFKKEDNFQMFACSYDESQWGQCGFGVQTFFQKIFFYVQQKKASHAGLKQHEGE